MTMTKHLLAAIALLVPFAAAQTTTIIHPLMPDDRGGAAGGRPQIVYTQLPPDPRVPALPARPAPAANVKPALLQRVAAAPRVPLSRPRPGVYDRVPNVYPPGQRPPAPPAAKQKVPSVDKAAAANPAVERLNKDGARLLKDVQNLEQRIARRAAARSQAYVDARIAGIERAHAARVNERVVQLRAQGKLEKLQLQRGGWVNPKTGNPAAIGDLPRRERSRLNAERSAAIKQANADRRAVQKYKAVQKKTVQKK
jgi:hypothetical protein